MTTDRRLTQQERFEYILQHVQSEGYAGVADLAEEMAVSAVTIRSDLNLLQRAGLLLRTHGGVLPMPKDQGSLSFAVRQRENIEDKRAIGAAAAATVRDGEAIILDASTTALHMARNLLGLHDLTVLTTGLYVALELINAPGITVLMPGGTVWHEAASISGSLDSRILDEGNFQKGFFGGRGLTLEEGLTDAHRAEVELKRKLISTVPSVNVIIDPSKLGRVAFATCAPIEDIDTVFTTTDADKAFIARIQDAGVRVVLA